MYRRSEEKSTINGLQRTLQVAQLPRICETRRAVFLQHHYLHYKYWATSHPNKLNLYLLKIKIQTLKCFKLMHKAEIFTFKFKFRRSPLDIEITGFLWCWNPYNLLINESFLFHFLSRITSLNYPVILFIFRSVVIPSFSCVLQ